MANLIPDGSLKKVRGGYGFFGEGPFDAFSFQNFSFVRFIDNSVLFWTS